MMNKKFYNLLIWVFLIAVFSACEKEEESPLSNDLLKKSSGPIIVGNTIEFAYAIGSTDHSKLKAVEITASIAGNMGTGISTHSRKTSPSGGQEEAVLIATKTDTDGAISRAYLVDTIAATIRYFYVVPEEARGKQLKFSFRSTSETGGASIASQTYNVSNVDIFKGLIMTSGNECYFSLETMQAYTKEQVTSQGLESKIDFVYIYKPTMGSGWTFGHGLVAPSNEEGYLLPNEIPAGASNKTLLERKYWPDGQLKISGTPTIYVDESDFRKAAFDGTITHAYGLGTDQGVLIKSQDGKYIAYLYINATSSNTKKIEFAVKRLTLL